MNALAAALFACLVAVASSKPSGIWGAHGYGHLPVVGASGVVSSGGAAGPTGIVNGHGAVGPNGIPNAPHVHGALVAPAAIGLGAGLAGLGLAGHGAIIAPAAAAVVAPGIAGHGLGLGLGLGHLGHLAHGAHGIW